MSLIRPLVRSLVRGMARSPLTRRGGFSPARLFAAGEQGAWYDPSDLSSMWQDSAGTTAAVVGQPVGRINDKSGRGNHATQGTSASRPTLQQDGSYYANLLDAFDDSFSAPGGGGTAGFFYCGAVHVLGGAGATRYIWSDRGAATGYIVVANTSNQLALLAGNGSGFTTAATTATLPVGETHIVTAWDDGVNLSVQIDQGAVTSVARPVVSAGGANFSEGVNPSGGGSMFNGRIYNRVYRKDSAPGAADRAAVQRFIASKAGVTL